MTGFGEYDGGEYFFHESDISDGTSFADLPEGEWVDFEVKAEPPGDKAPPARKVRRRGGRRFAAAPCEPGQRYNALMWPHVVDFVGVGSAPNT